MGVRIFTLLLFACITLNLRAQTNDTLVNRGNSTDVDFNNINVSGFYSFHPANNPGGSFNLPPAGDSYYSFLTWNNGIFQTQLNFQNGSFGRIYTRTKYVPSTWAEAPYSNWSRIINTENENGDVSIDGDMKLSDGRVFRGAQFYTNDYSTMTFQSRAWQSVQGLNGKAFSFQTHNNGGQDGFEMMAIYYGEGGKITLTPNGGNVGIGTENPQEKLSVNGKIRAKEIKVETANWPDYVFEENYRLPDLKETEHFIKVNKHLPGIPSAKEVEEDGISLGEMNVKLLKKVEELTLYIIKQESRLDSQEEIIESLLKKAK